MGALRLVARRVVCGGLPILLAFSFVYFQLMPMAAHASKAASANAPSASAGATLSNGTPVPSCSVQSPAWSGAVSTSRAFTVSWCATGSTAAAYDIQYADASSGLWRSWLSGTTARSRSFTGAEGHTYFFRVRARNASGTVGAFSAPSHTSVPVDDTHLYHSAGWTKASQPGAYLGYTHYARLKGKRATRAFTGTAVIVRMTKGRGRGKAQIYLDGELVKTVDTLASTTSLRQSVYASHVPMGQHSIEIKVLGTSGRPRVDVDAIEIYTPLSKVNVVLFGDSTFKTDYLSSLLNPSSTMLPPHYDGRLHRVVQSALWARGIKAAVSNRSVGGMDSYGAITQHYAGSQVSPWVDCLAAKPQIVVINFGANDLRLGNTVSGFKADITRMVVEAKAAGVTPVLATCLAYPYPMHYAFDLNAQLRPYSDAIEEVADSYGVALADNRAAFETEIAAGHWNLFGRNDASYLPKWENDSAPGSTAYETQQHPWVGGVAVMADTITAAIAPIAGPARSQLNDGARRSPANSSH